MSFGPTSTTVISAAFLASLVEFVEAFTIILAVSIVDGWRSALAGSLAGLLLLALIVILLGPLLTLVPLRALQLVIGVLLLLFGLRWLRKAVLRSAGVIPLHDEDAAFAVETEGLRRRGIVDRRSWLGIGGAAAFKAVVLEGAEVVFIVLALGAGRGLLWPASLGALIACALVFVTGLVVHRPLARVPENTLKFGVGLILSAFGTFWTGEGLGIAWTGGDLTIVPIAGAYLLASVLIVRFRRQGRS